MSKIAICVNAYNSTGGCEAVTQKIANYFSEKHYEVRIFTRFSKKINRKTDNITIEYYDSSNINSFLPKIKKYDPNFTLIYSDVFDFFHQTIDAIKNVCVAFCGGNRLCTKPYALKIFTNQMNTIKSFICHTKNERDYKLAERLGLLNKTHLIPIGVDLEEFDNNTIERDQLITNKTNDFWILNVSNFFPGKGQTHFIKILSKLVSEHGLENKITYIQMCTSLDFSLGQQLEMQWRSRMNSIKGIQTILMKDKKREQVVAAFKNSNSFAFPSEKESAGLVLLESQAASCPWVSTNIGFAPELDGGFCIPAIKDKNHNSIFDDRVISFFANKINDCFTNKSLGEIGKKQIEEKYQWKNILPLYEELL